MRLKPFRAELDGKWLMFSNDKGRNYVYTFDEQCPYGVHELKVQVEDIVGNVTEKTWWFKKYPYTPPPKKNKRNQPGKRNHGKEKIKTGNIMVTLQEGDKAPAFTGKDQNGNKISLAIIKGKKLILYFYSEAGSPTCTLESCNLRDNYSALKKKGFEVLGVSPDDEQSAKEI